MGNHLVHHELERQAHWRSDKPAIVFEGTEHTFGGLDERVNRTARALRDAGLGQGDRLVVHGHNHGDLFTLFFACSKLGAVYSTISTYQSRTNVEYICDTLEPAAICYTAGEDILDGSLPDVRSAAPEARFLSLDADGAVDDQTLDEFITGYDDGPPRGSDDHDAADAHNIFWTSGTTGRPKAVVRDHKAAIHFNDALMSTFPFGPENVRLTTNDMMFAAPYLQYGLPTVSSGTTNVILRRFDPAAAYQNCIEYGVTVMMLVFTQGKVLLEYLEENGLELSLRAIHGVVPSAKRAHDLSALSDEVYQIFATTESGVVLVEKLTEPFDDPPRLGIPGRCADVRLIPVTEDGIPTAPARQGDEGELFVRGDTMMTRYLTDENQRKYVRDGWLRTGDAMRVVDGGQLVFAGRIDDRIRSGGINVYPADVETVLLEHPGVEEAVVVGVDDETWGQRVCALVVTSASVTDVAALEAELDERCKTSDELTSEMRPRSYAFVDSRSEVPTGAVNKVDRDRVVDQYFE